MPRIPNAPMNPLSVPLVTCSVCRNTQTVARSAASQTLTRWNVVAYPNDCRCPTCSGGVPARPPAPPEAPPPPKPKKTYVPRNRATVNLYYEAAKQLGEFTTDEIRRCEGLPNTFKAGGYLWQLVVAGKLKKIERSKFKVIEQ